MQLAINAARLEASQAAAESMLQRYRDGLRDGASLSRGAAVNLGSIAGSTPDSSGVGRPSLAVSRSKITLLNMMIGGLGWASLELIGAHLELA